MKLIQLRGAMRAGVFGPLAIAVIFLAIAASAVAVWGAKSTRDQIDRGQKVYDAVCASCHGTKLEGQANWKAPKENGRLPAPPHDASGHTWHHADGVIFGIIKNGLKPYAGDDYESDMQPFAGILTDDDITAVVAFIKSTWSEREKTYQSEITRQAELEN